MAVINATFVEEGAYPGLAKGWALVSRCQAERWAAFGTNPPSACEAFEGWSTRQLTFEPGQLVLAFFAPGGFGHDGFDRGWSNDLYQVELSLALSAGALFAGSSSESFDWIGPLHATWASVESIGGLLDDGAQGVEWFESEWGNNAFRFSWSFVPSLPATFSSGAAETFQGAWPTAATR